MTNFSIKYNNIVVNGEYIDIKQVTNQPTVTFDATDSLYTLLMDDPTAPFPETPVYANYLHWLIINIPQNKIANGDIILNYHPPSPLEKSSAHTYRIILYKQKQKINIDPQYIEKIKKQSTFPTEKFANTYGLTEVAKKTFLTSNRPIKEGLKIGKIPIKYSYK